MQGDLRLYSGVKFTRDSSRVLDHNAATILNDIAGSLVASFDNVSFIRETTTRVKVAVNYGTAITCNYMAIRNYPYSNIWCFMFIDRIEYVNEATTYIYYTIDHYHTWHAYLRHASVFVEREHQDDSTLLNLNPEPIAPTQYVQLSVDRYTFENYSIVMAYTDVNADSLSGYIIGNMASAAKIKAFPLRYIEGVPSMTAFFNEVEAMQGEYGEIVSIFMYPSRLIDISDAVSGHAQFGSPVTRHWHFNKPTSMFGYTPKNKKMFTYPFMQLRVSNGEQFCTYRPERFHAHTALADPISGFNFNIVGGAMPTAEVNCYPAYYDGYDTYNNTATTSQCMTEKIPLGPLPQVAFPIDTYKSWIAQSQSSSLMPIITGMVTGGFGGGVQGSPQAGLVGAAGAGLSGVGSFITQEQSAKDASNHWAGAQGGSLDLAQSLKGFYGEILVPPERELITIDRFFSAYGYAANKTGRPTHQNRQNWNYVKVRGAYCYGPIPQDSLEYINNLFNKGVTIWHNYTNFGDYGDYSNPVV